MRNFFKLPMSHRLVIAFSFLSVFIVGSSLVGYYVIRDPRIFLLIALVSGTVSLIFGIYLARTLASTASSMATTLKIASLRSLDISESIEDVTKKIADSSKGIAEATSAQSEQAENTSRLINELAQAITSVARSAEDAAEISKKTSESAQSAGESAEKSFERLNTIKAIVTNASGMSNTLSLKSEKIVQIVGVITSLAEQTNLLALNAAIEAARAGEAGRGFAVVAEEIRKLAESSAEFGKQIREIVEDIQGQIKESNVSISAGVTEVEKSSEIITSALASLSKIALMSQDVSAKIEDISAATAQQSASSQQIVTSIDSIADAAESNAAGSKQISDSMDLELKSLSDLSAASKQLVELSESLQQFIGMVPKVLESAKITYRAKLDKGIK